MPNYSFNKQFAKPGDYQTALSPENENRFNNWLAANAEHPALQGFDPKSKTEDYDMRGWWLKNNGIAPPANGAHFEDTFKTPYHETFSNESQYALPTAPRWVNQGPNWFLIGQDGKVLKSE